MSINGMSDDEYWDAIDELGDDARGMLADVYRRDAYGDDWPREPDGPPCTGRIEHGDDERSAWRM